MEGRFPGPATIPLLRVTAALLICAVQPVRAQAPSPAAVTEQPDVCGEVSRASRTQDIEPDASPAFVDDASCALQNGIRNDLTLAHAYEQWQIGQFERVLALIQPLAESGNPQAEFVLGGLYSLGQGVPQDDGLAAH